LAVPFFSTNIFAILHYSPTSSDGGSLVEDRIIIWDNTQREINKIIEVRDPVINIHFTKRFLVVVEKTRVFAYNIRKDYQRHVIFEQREFNESKITTIADEDDHYGIVIMNSHSGVLNRLGERIKSQRGVQGIRH
jgi:hypothetical protein